MKSAFLRPGNRMFTAATGLGVLIAFAHMGSLFSGPLNDDWAEAMDAMRAATFEMGPLSMSFFGVLAGVWIEVSALLIMLAAKNVVLLAVAPADALPRLIRAMSILDAIAYAALTLLFVYYQIPPPIISFAVLALAFLAAAVLSKKAESSAKPAGGG